MAGFVHLKGKHSDDDEIGIKLSDGARRKSGTPPDKAKKSKPSRGIDITAQVVGDAMSYRRTNDRRPGAYGGDRDRKSGPPAERKPWYLAAGVKKPAPAPVAAAPVDPAILFPPISGATVVSHAPAGPWADGYDAHLEVLRNAEFIARERAERLAQEREEQEYQEYLEAQEAERERLRRERATLTASDWDRPRDDYGEDEDGPACHEDTPYDPRGAPDPDGWETFMSRQQVQKARRDRRRAAEVEVAEPEYFYDEDGNMVDADGNLIDEDDTAVDDDPVWAAAQKDRAARAGRSHDPDDTLNAHIGDISSKDRHGGSAW